jgi:hypothetical protein
MLFVIRYPSAVLRASWLFSYSGQVSPQELLNRARQLRSSLKADIRRLIREVLLPSLLLFEPTQ